MRGASDRAVARHTAYNVLGQGLPLLVALAAVPVLLRGLGEARFGILALVWMLVALLGEVGFARAGTRFAANALAAGRGHEVRGIAGVTLRAQVALGVAMAGALALLAPWVAGGVFDVGPEHLADATRSFLLVAAFLPVLTVSAALRGLLEADHRFALLNGVRTVGISLTYLAPVAALLAGWGLTGVVASVLVARAAMAVAFGWAGRDLLRPTPLGGTAPLPPPVRELLAFGGWAAVSTVVSPLLVALDRVLLGARAGVGAVGVYAAPYEAATRVLLLPGALSTTLFPALSALEGGGDGARSRALTRRATTATFLVVAPVALVLAVGAEPLLHLWLGGAYAPEQAPVLRLLAAGVLVNALALVPFNALQARGRADLPARFHLVELPLHAALTWVLVGRWGAVGAAGAWAARAAVDAALLFGALALLERREGGR